MKKKSKVLEDASLLRQEAEEQLKLRKDEQSWVSTTETDKLRLIHEHEVKQIELENQNEELVIAKEKAEPLTEVEVNQIKLKMQNNELLAAKEKAEFLEKKSKYMTKN